MGIVVSLAMLLGIIFLSKKRFYSQDNSSWFMVLGLVFLVSTGLWNAVWHGLQNMGTFWGMVALVSGIITLSAAFLLYNNGRLSVASSDSTNQLSRILSLTGLGLCFALYAVTIIQINLGLPYLM